tara:strand:+ start:36981 stop:37550 length:570 start_codon:yes stop_codon:yes gene_type:complete
MKIGFFGGTFNPPHKGHEKIIDYCSTLFDKLLIFPNIISPDKLNSPPVNFNHRVNMLKLVIHKNNIVIDTYEIESGVPNYTFYTIQYLMGKYKNSKLFMVIGKDQLINLDNWYNSTFIKNNINILCFDRLLNQESNQLIENYPNVELVNFDFSISSSYIREKIHQNNDIDSSLLSHEIKKYINKHHLYA